MRYARLIGCVVVALLLVSTLPYAAGATAIQVKPHKFKPCTAGDPNNWIQPDYLRGDGGPAIYYALVNLPVGKHVTRLTLFYKSPGTDATSVWLDRVRKGDIRQTVASITTSANTGEDFWTLEETSIDLPLVKAGFTYYVVVLTGTNTAVRGVKINYE